MKAEERVAAIIAMLRRQVDPLARRDGDEWLAAGAMADVLGAAVDRTTIFRDLQGLVDKGVVVAEGGTRSRRYRLAPDSREFLIWELGQPKGNRARVQYDPGVLERYVPNVTSWLGKTQLKHLRGLAAPKFRAGDAAYRRVMTSLSIDLSYASSRLEDVNISWLDTKSLIELGERPEGLSDKEYRIVMNHKDAIRFICENPRTKKLRFISMLLSGFDLWRKPSRRSNVKHWTQPECPVPSSGTGGSTALERATTRKVPFRPLFARAQCRLWVPVPGLIRSSICVTLPRQQSRFWRTKQAEFTTSLMTRQFD